MEISIQKSNQLKALAILMMLFLHLFNREYEGLFKPLLFINEVPLSYYLSLFSDACVPIFCFVSGYGLYFKYHKASITYASGNIKRIKKLYLVYWIILILFAVLLGLALNKEGYPGSFGKFILNFTALDNSYNGAWWFFFTYILLVATSGFLFKLLQRLPTYLIGFTFLFYFVSFYFRIYKPAVFDFDVLNWAQKQFCLYGTSLLPFLMGAVALKYKWNTRISNFFSRFSYKILISSIGIVWLIIIHGIIPNFVIAPFTAIAFIFLFLHIRLPAFIYKTLDFLAPHATNMWLIHMFFYLTFFSEFIYSVKYVPLIFGLLVLCSVISSSFVNRINVLAQRKIRL